MNDEELLDDFSDSNDNYFSSDFLTITDENDLLLDVYDDEFDDNSSLMEVDMLLQEISLVDLS